jgi:hypothetical protein
MNRLEELGRVDAENRGQGKVLRKKPTFNIHM